MDASVEFHARLRLRDFDYRSTRAYFVTMCVSHRACVFGSVSGAKCQLSRRGVVARDCWLDIPKHHPHVELDAFVIMPNHVHGILLFTGDAPVVATPASRPSLATGPMSGSLGAVVGAYKAAVSRNINRLRPDTARNLWQQNFYDHIIRSDHSHDLIRHYITMNPPRWDRDGENPEGHGGDDVRTFCTQLMVSDDPSLRDGRDAGVATTDEAP